MNPTQFKQKSQQAFIKLKKSYPFAMDVSYGKNGNKNGYWFADGENAMRRTFFEI